MLDSKEIWKDLKGFEGIYQVSNLGRVKSLSRVVRCNKGTTRLPEKIMKGQRNHDGYVRYQIGNRKIFGHRLVMETFCPIDGRYEVNHKNLDKADNRICNLEWVSHRHNMLHAKENGALDNRKTRPTKKAIDLTTGEEYNSPKEMAEHFDVHISTVYGACNGYHLLKGHKVAYG